MAPAKDAGEEGTPQQTKEKELLAKLFNIKKMKLDISQRGRKQERVSSAMMQVIMEDVPMTIMNVLYLELGCGQDDVQDDVQDDASNIKQVAFLGSTAASIYFGSTLDLLRIYFGSKKWLEWKQVQADRKNVE